MSDADLRRNLRPGDLLVVRHDFAARSPDELTLRRNDRVELLQLDEGFWDGWWLGRHIADNRKGLFPGVYTTPASNHPSAQPGAPASGTTVTTDTTATTDTPATSSLSYSYQQQQQQPGSDSEPDPTIQELWQPVSSIVNSLTDDFQYDNSQVGIGPAPAMSQGRAGLA
ncbi:polar growth protein [Ascosphaera atra]|nr:polar growth protein [Ascosphaera atra]